MPNGSNSRSEPASTTATRSSSPASMGRMVGSKQTRSPLVAAPAMQGQIGSILWTLVIAPVLEALGLGRQADHWMTGDHPFGPAPGREQFDVAFIIRLHPVSVRAIQDAVEVDSPPVGGFENGPRVR